MCVWVCGCLCVCVIVCVCGGERKCVCACVCICMKFSIQLPVLLKRKWMSAYINESVIHTRCSVPRMKQVIEYRKCACSLDGIHN